MATAVRPLSVLAVVALSVGGCGSSTHAPPPASQRLQTPARLEIVSPAPNGSTGASVELVLRLTHAELVPPSTTGHVRPDRGHVHVFIDGKLVAMSGRLRDRLHVAGTGEHTIQAEFVASDHRPFANRVVAAVSFDVR